MGEVSVLLSDTEIHASIRGVEGANQETSVGVNNTIIQPDLLPAFRSSSLYVPLDLGLLRFGDTLKEGGVALYSKENPLLHTSPTKAVSCVPALASGISILDVLSPSSPLGCRDVS